jgi:hypothetical protein
VLAPERVSQRERVVLVVLAAFMIASQQSSLPLSGVLLAVLVLVRRLSLDIGGKIAATLHWHLILPPALAILGLCAVNLGAHGRFAVSPFGNVFLLARVIYDGPGMAVLRRDCPAAGWRLCPFLGRFPPAVDDFLWTRDGPLDLAGGAKAVSRDANAIITRAIAADTAGIARASLANMLEQFSRFDSGDGLEPWPSQVKPWIERDFPPREQAAYASALQQRGLLRVPPVLALAHRVTALLGVAACLVLVPVAVRRRAACLGFLVTVLIAIPLSAAITGGLSTPHDRYQSRIMWLPPFMAAVSLASLRRPPAGDFRLRASA